MLRLIEWKLLLLLGLYFIAAGLSSPGPVEPVTPASVHAAPGHAAPPAWQAAPGVPGPAADATGPSPGVASLPLIHKP